MSLSWSNRKAQLGVLLKSHGDEDEDALALDRLLHAQNLTRKSSQKTEIESLRFQDRDLHVVGTLERGQFGVIDVVMCLIDDRVYVRKSTEKVFASRMRHQCSPQLERDILLRATKSKSRWVPHLLCAFQTTTHLNLVMDYAEGGTLWDVLESSPDDGKLLETDLKWWVPQIVSAIHWCHSQGFAHRDIKPHNFVLTASAHVLLIDFGSAAPLLPPRHDGNQLIERHYCLVLCGTCDYISPEILRAHEEALVALEMEDDDGKGVSSGEYHSEGYGLETDWWSLGAMMYEMAYGVAPFFAKDIRQTYLKIMNHKQSLRFEKAVAISAEYQDLLRRLLTNHEHRIGRCSINEITEHSFFNATDWQALPNEPAPTGLHLPQFTYSVPAIGLHEESKPQSEESNSQPFSFSPLFQSSQITSPGLSALHTTPSHRLSRSIIADDPASSFIGFSWGPTKEAFPEPENGKKNHHTSPPRSIQLSSTKLTTNQLLMPVDALSAAGLHCEQFATPIRASASTPHQTLTRTSTNRRTSSRRPLSDRQAMKQLVDCVSMSARKKVLESGRKPRILTSFNRSVPLKELRFPSSSCSDSVSSDKAALVPEISGSEETDTDGPPSPSPRPGSALSTMSRRSGTPTVSGSYSQRGGPGGVPLSRSTALNPTARKFFGGDPPELPKPRRAEHRKQTSLSEREKRPPVTHGPSNVPEPHQAEHRGATLDELEEKHALLMQDILDIQQRLEDISMWVEGRE